MIKNAMAVLAGLALAAPVAMADKGYQKTGPVLDVTDKSIVLDAGKDGKWEFARDANTKVEGDLKKGSKVTVYYTMTATKVEVKGEPKAKGKEKAAEKGAGAGAPAAR